MKLKLQSSQPTLSYRVGAALRHCHPKYELFSLEKAAKSPILSESGEGAAVKLHLIGVKLKSFQRLRRAHLMGI